MQIVINTAYLHGICWYVIWVRDYNCHLLDSSNNAANFVLRIYASLLNTNNNLRGNGGSYEREQFTNYFMLQNCFNKMHDIAKCIFKNRKYLSISENQKKNNFK